ncbi:hypothetical protein GCM10022255_113650 [Dactylosporangium darangshiense]|uniref:LysM domain-containing protein n=2 Tax=Dactylosporangium darangshiense TaxID=579108 RepID=A0ABP8DVI7_9ACTN
MTPSAAAPVGPSQSPGPTVDVAPRYYVVGPSQTGQREYLYQIAVRTLGDGNRYPEIFELNKDRRQPDGGRLTDPAELQPGWILQLPADAKGPGVMVGPLPSQATNRLGAVAVPRPGLSSEPSIGGLDLYVIGTVSLSVLVLLSALVLRRRQLRPSRLTLTPRRLLTTALAAPAFAGSLESGTIAAPPAATPASSPVADRTFQATVGTAVPAEAKPVETTVTAGTAAGVPPAGSGGAEPQAPSTEAVSAAVEPTGSSPSTPAPVATVAVVRPDLGRGRVSVQVLGLGHQPPDLLDVRLIGSGGAESEAVYAWLGDEPLPTSATLPVILGRYDQWELFVDLTGTPDVFTITGPLAVARRQALVIAEQLSAAGSAVTIVNDAIAASDLASADRIRRFPVLDEEFEALSKPGIVISGGLRGAALAAARKLVERSDRRVVPVLIGQVLRASWSIRVTQGGSEAS